MSDEGNEFEQNAQQVGHELDESAQQFGKAVEEGGVAHSVTVFGQTLQSQAETVTHAADDLGEGLETAMQQGLHSEGFGTGFGQELAEGVTAVMGELAEGVGSAGLALGGAVVNTVGEITENFGQAGGDIADAGSALIHGDLGGAVSGVTSAVGNVAEGIGKGAFDLGEGVVRAGAELVEGAAETAWEIGEGAVETTVGLARDIGGLAEGAWDAVTDLF